MRNMSKLSMWLIPSVLVAAAVFVLVNGPATLASALALAALVSAVLIGRFRQRAPIEAPALEAEFAETLRSERDESGEMQAVKHLRALHPRLSILQAVTIVRDL